MKDKVFWKIVKKNICRFLTLKDLGTRMDKTLAYQSVINCFTITASQISFQFRLDDLNFDRWLSLVTYKLRTTSVDLLLFSLSVEGRNENSGITQPLWVAIKQEELSNKKLGTLLKAALYLVISKKWIRELFYSGAS